MPGSADRPGEALRQDDGSDGGGGLAARLDAAFREHFGSPPASWVRAPGRVNLIGEHTDYNDGFVLPLAIDRAVWIGLRPRDDGRVRLRSADFGETVGFELDTVASGPAAGVDPGWAGYVKGAAWALGDAGHGLTGWDGVIGGDVPVGAGLSSSAALSVAALRAFAAVSGIPWQPLPMARLAQRVENDWVGVSCGIMDPLISAVGREGHAVLIDCRSLDTRAVPLPEASTVVILDTTTRRELVGSAYNERRRQCEAAAAHFGVPALRDVTPAMVEATGGAANGLDETTRARARHVVTENARTLAAADALETGDAATVGRLMDESHASLREDFEVSSPELDAMVAAARAAGCHGARMTGAGFGGCAVALVDAADVDGFIQATVAGYRDRTGLEPHVYRTTGGPGADVVAPV
jgi:galactokinase